MKKRKIWITVISLSLVCAMLVTGIAVLLSRNTFHSDKESDQTQESAETTDNHGTPSDHTQDIPVPPVKDDHEKTTTNKPTLDVTEMGRDPNPSVIDSTIEYETKEADTDVE